MSHFSEIVSLLCQSHLLLAFTFVVFISLDRTANAFGVAMPFSGQLRWAQVLILLSLSAPTAIHFLPPTIAKSEFQIPTESRIEKGLRKVRLVGMPQAASNLSQPQYQKLTSVSENALQVWHWVHNLASRPNVWMISLWFVGLLVSIGFFAIRLRRLLGTLSAGHLIRKLGRLRVLVSPDAVVPFSVFLGRHSYVILPEYILARPKDVKLALSHELQHIRTNDTVWAMAQEVLTIPFFGNPFVALWKTRISDLQEFACDEALTQRKGFLVQEYGSCLVRVATAAIGSRCITVGTTGMAMGFGEKNGSKSKLRRRMEMLLVKDRKGLSPIGIGLATATSVLFTVAAAFAASQSAKESRENSVNSGSANVDEMIQLIAETSLQEAIKAQEASGGFAIVTDPNTGQILAIANVDNTTYAKVDRGLHWALSHRMEPASFLKAIVSAEALEQGLTTLDEKHRCENSNYVYGGRTYHDDRSEGWFELSTTETVAQSSNICALKIGEKIGASGLLSMLKKFGFGPGGSASEYPEARSGVLPIDDGAKQSIVIPHTALGFGFRVTPLELTQAFGAIANGGQLMAPASADADSAKIQPVRRVLSAATAEKAKSILREVVLSGTARKKGSSRLYTTAGKTATSFWPGLTQSEVMGGKKMSDFGGFIGFAPYEKPRVQVLVGIREPKSNNGAHGSTHAAPVFKEIAEKVLLYMKVAPDQVRD